MRDKEGIINTLLDQAELAVCGKTKEFGASRTKTAIKGNLSKSVIDRVKQEVASVPVNGQSAEAKRALAGCKEELLDGTLLFPRFNPSRHIPVEILHTFLLGVIKYLWYETTKDMKPDILDRFGSRLNDLSHRSIVGSKTSLAKYIVKYSNSLIGRHFKEIIQLGAFALDGLPGVSPELFNLWIDLGRLTSLVWFAQITDMERYLRYLRRASGNVLDGFAKLFPAKILRKVKLHLLAHLEEDVVAFGPLVGESAERFESFNAVFRQSVVFSNRKNTSRDVAFDCAEQERVRMAMSGGYIRERRVTEQGTEQTSWRPPSDRIISLLEGSGFLKKQFALWYPKEAPGNVVKATRKQKPGDDLVSRLSSISNGAEFPDVVESPHFAQPCSQVSSREGDRCSEGTWVFALAAAEPLAGRISRIFLHAEQSYFIVDHFTVDEEQGLERRFKMPVLKSSGRSVLIQGENLLYDFNVQEIAGKFLVNLHSLHHQDLLYGTLRPELLNIRLYLYCLIIFIRVTTICIIHVMV